MKTPNTLLEPMTNQVPVRVALGRSDWLRIGVCAVAALLNALDLGFQGNGNLIWSGVFLGFVLGLAWSTFLMFGVPALARNLIAPLKVTLTSAAYGIAIVVLLVNCIHLWGGAMYASPIVGGTAVVVYLLFLAAFLFIVLLRRRVPRYEALEMVEVSTVIFFVGLMVSYRIAERMTFNGGDSLLIYLPPVVPVAAFVIWMLSRKRRIR